MKKKLAALIIAAAMAASFTACGSPSASTSSSSAAESSSSTTEESTTATYATLDAYNQVKEGMSLDDVNKIFGFDGTSAASGSASVGSISSTAEVYTWAGETPGSSASISFQDGKVVAMAQAGLK
ncbi:MAG: hypothetical protein LKG48_04590 [Lachnospiraceae bacterium]|jgi:ABC-type oligopeptide transport system substrate-binding subunit|nr:hypothetical protein [Lachnospiraceae bacterium]MCH4104315.1 hypothetical protein [Lachnospiraceae bacterium]MCI1309024.1 hypothetical protein [Lachnospiraceae bacterium]MCI1357063.1 hypothetical protein [Lachnospiraceae bacterium]MCI1357131.1 hypothetical protein [Lachnospiraceae bacterium]